MEIIYDLNILAQYSHAEGTAQNTGIDFDLILAHQAIIHRHFDNLNDMFSPLDIWQMMLQIVGNNVITPNNYFWGMIGTSEAPYIMKVKDASKIQAYLQSHNFTQFDIKYNSKFNFPFGSQGNLNNKLNEIGFLQMLKDESLVDAIELYRGNNFFNNWEKLGTDSRKSFTIPCR